MSGPLELERVVFLQDIDCPLNVKGASPKMDKVFDVDGRMGRVVYRLELVGEWIRITDFESGHFEMVPVTFVRQVRAMRESTKAKLEARLAQWKAQQPKRVA